ncbi:NADPH dehydrogenase NamA [Pseudalkalibacillus salsuginis]|uniref:NADPH dehydrogenase NamA n=1 Tax=Pseudalkalibacillus salsuginis TaxID=2910972 RepID=UPI001F269004|nr:NADPH dehydrogenase NamA [Pseudalkalibacillus salsuginis]MCF6408355.1 NADPH dehydrogenase NamA [Pseudalkalibacillus salsuginis]
MAVKLFEPITFQTMVLKNRIVMSPMCMYSCHAQDGKVTTWHTTHYTTRAVGQVGLIFVEATAVNPQGRISMEDLGIWNDGHVKGLANLVDLVHEQDSKIGIQLAHSGRKAIVEGPIYSSSPVPFKDDMEVPTEMTVDKIKETVEDFRQAARRSREAGFDVIEIHGAHGYLINQFLSPLINKRTDEYGGTKEKRFNILREIITAVKSEWNGPIFVRISANDYNTAGYSVDDYIDYAHWMKELGIDLIDCSSGGVVPAKIKPYPGYQVQYAEKIRTEASIATGAVGMITSPLHAEEILQNGRADLIFLARELLRDPYWPRRAAQELNVQLNPPKQYLRGW